MALSMSHVMLSTRCAKSSHVKPRQAKSCLNKPSQATPSRTKPHQAVSSCKAASSRIKPYQKL